MGDFNFWQRNEGEIVGTLGAFMIAILASIYASYLTKKNIRLKDTDIYNGILSLIHTELGAQKQRLNLLRNTLKILLDASVTNKNFPINELPMKFDLSILDYALLKIYEYKDYHQEISTLLVHYRNLIKGVNTSLEFKNSIKMINDGIGEVEDTIASYFNVLDKEYLDKMNLAIETINDLIEENIDDKKKLVILKNI
ncbi:MAG: hypothetical protein WD398_14985 [Cyclobacteriaceae bacterium]